jgi:hypothetical protein
MGIEDGACLSWMFVDALVAEEGSDVVCTCMVGHGRALSGRAYQVYW